MSILLDYHLITKKEKIRKLEPYLNIKTGEIVYPVEKYNVYDTTKNKLIDVFFKVKKIFLSKKKKKNFFDFLFFKKKDSFFILENKFKLFSSDFYTTYNPTGELITEEILTKIRINFFSLNCKTKFKIKYYPKTKGQLVQAIKKEIYEIQGTRNNPNWNADLNCIDTSLITDMSELFLKEYGLEKFNGDISKWNVSNVTNMSWMFYKSEFNGNISNWNVSNVKNMYSMFANSQFNGDISNWDVSNVENMEGMFFYSKFNKDINNWNINNVKNMKRMFTGSDFNKDIGSWPLKKDTDLKNISVSSKYKKLPDKIIYSETVANIFIRSINNPDNTFNIDNFKKILKYYLNSRKAIYQNKDYKLEIINKLILNDIADILKYLKDKEIQQKFIEITMNKNDKEPEIEIS